MQRNEEQQDVFAFTADSTQYIDPFQRSEEAPQQEAAAPAAPEIEDSFALPPKQDEGVVEECLPEGWRLTDDSLFAPNGVQLALQGDGSWQQTIDIFSGGLGINDAGFQQWLEMVNIASFDSSNPFG